MDETNRQQLYDHAKKWVLEAGYHIKDRIDDPLSIDTKENPNDLVTEMDRHTEKVIAEKIATTYPDHKLLSEEGFGHDISDLAGVVWIVDPIDGTMNFVHQKRNFAISVGIFIDGVGEIGLIYNVMEDTLYNVQRGKGAFKNGEKLPNLEDRKLEEAIIGLNNFWTSENRKVDEKKMQKLVRKVRGTRSYGSAALEFAFVAEGIVDAYLTMNLAPWDIAAGVILVNEVGGITTTADGKELDMLNKSTVLTCNPSLYHQIVNEYVDLK
ncbi:inositol monophosphatase family protein [Aquibacillus sp. 3ASR75-11]|uniref:inositol-phosphate phosphatase n=1 Tax=Terrihalobacillus insolitus TaxID=2950438 RepID=A0A9X3WSA1_9BACI|nr:inositol monophosphatase family protein [Terrihalobacillus insolitus]MDC3412785.1 inositol monophosphatase family protein [Terrihalobacillus insolitus]MDC3423738.1 inositol monophosphatase family protein [Terrihalobacillus insolitus]